MSGQDQATTPPQEPPKLKVTPTLQFFKFGHLPEGQARDVSQKFKEMALEMERILPPNPEKSTCIRKLLEAKDCAVRAVLFDNQFN